LRRRCGINEDDNRTNICICNKHKIITEAKDVRLLPINCNNQETKTVLMHLPCHTSFNESNNERTIRINHQHVQNSSLSNTNVANS
jgi:hypothetical protein